jgi:hypothetical protein
MRAERKRATAPTVAPSNSTNRVYHRVSRHTSRIDGALAALVFNLQSPRTDARERTAVLDTIDALIRLKIDTGLLKGGAA